MVINGVEVTRGMPPGHRNAVFLKDANELLIEDPVEGLRAAKAQDAFIFWDHPSWSRHARDGIARLHPMHIELIEEGLIHGIEVVNHYRFSLVFGFPKLKNPLAQAAGQSRYFLCPNRNWP